MDAWSLPKARPISCNDCPAFQRHHMSIRWFAESFILLLNLINTTFREKIYTRWCCIDRLSWQGFSESGNLALATFREKYFTGVKPSSGKILGPTSRAQRLGRQ